MILCITRIDKDAHGRSPAGARRARHHATARSWQTEAPLRMLQNNLDPRSPSGRRPGRLRRHRPRRARLASYDAIVRTLTTLADDETLLCSRRPVGVHAHPRVGAAVLIANSNLVGDWATWPEFRRLERSA
jgi:urocanate hydratase